MGRGTGLAQESLAAHVVVEVAGVDDLQGDVTVQTGVVRLVGHPHRAAAEFEETAILAAGDLEMFKGGGLVRHDLRRSSLEGGSER